MTLAGLDTRIIPAGMIALTDMLVAYAQRRHDLLPAGETPPAWLSTILAMASLPAGDDEPVLLPVTGELLAEAHKAAAEGGHDWAKEALLSVEDKSEMFLVSRSFIDEYAELVSNSRMRSIHKMLRLQAVQVMIDEGRRKRSTDADDKRLRPEQFMGAVGLADWIPISTRLPTEQDADKNGDVLWLRSGIEMLGRVRSSPPVDATHWRPAHKVQPKEPERSHVAHN